MQDNHHPLLEQAEVHDQATLAQARAVLEACRSPQEIQEAVLAAVARNEEWRGKQCLNLPAPEAPSSPTVRAFLSSEVGIRAAEGHIGPVNRSLSSLTRRWLSSVGQYRNRSAGDRGALRSLFAHG